MYRFTAGPDSEPYTVRTPYTKAAVNHAIKATGMSRDSIHGALIMLGSGFESLLDMVIESTDGSGLKTSLREIHTALRG